MNAPNQFLNVIRDRIGSPKRALGWFNPSPLAFPEPPWLSAVSEKDDPTKLIFAASKDIWKHGVVVWGAVVMANRLLFEPGADDCPGLMIFSVSDSDETALASLPKLVSRLYQLQDCKSPDPGWTERELGWWEDLNNAMSFLKGIRLPPEWQEGTGDYKGSSIFFHRAHLPEGRIKSRILPMLVDPVSSFAQTIPCEYWPEGMEEYLAGNFGLECQSLDPPGALDHPPEVIADREQREVAYAEVFGPIVSVFHELIPSPQHIDVYRFEWPEPRGEHGYVTGGMSDVFQPGGGDFARIELVFYAKRSDEKFAKLLQSFAHYPWQTGVPIGPWDSIPLGDFAEAALGSPRFPALMFFPGVAKPESRIHQATHLAPLGIRYLTVVPITREELDLKLNMGIQAVCERLQEVRFDLAFTPDRPSFA